MPESILARAKTEAWSLCRPLADHVDSILMAEIRRILRQALLDRCIATSHSSLVQINGMHVTKKLILVLNFQIFLRILMMLDCFLKLRDRDASCCCYSIIISVMMWWL